MTPTGQHLPMYIARAILSACAGHVTNMYISSITGATVMLRDPQISVNEADMNVSVCVILEEPIGGLERDVVVSLDITADTAGKTRRQRMCNYII